MRKFIEKLKSIILPTPSSFTGGRKNNASLIVEELIYSFNKSIERMSTERNLMFDSSYVVYIPKSYYKKIHLSFGYITQEVRDRFQEILQEIIMRKKNMKFAPLSDKWSFDLVFLPPKGEDTPDEDDPESTVTSEELEEKFVAVRSFPVADEKFNFNDHSDDEEVLTNQSQPNSIVRKMRVLNIGAIRGLKENGIGFEYPIELNRSNSYDPTTDKHKSEVRLYLRVGDGWSFISPDGIKCGEIKISVTHFYIGGTSASNSYNGLPMIRMDAETVLSPHLEIKEESDGIFYLRSFGPVLMNNVTIQKNRWAKITDKNATLKINDSIKLIITKK